MTCPRCSSPRQDFKKYFCFSCGERNFTIVTDAVRLFAELKHVKNSVTYHDTEKKYIVDSVAALIAEYQGN